MPREIVRGRDRRNFVRIRGPFKETDKRFSRAECEYRFGDAETFTDDVEHDVVTLLQFSLLLGDWAISCSVNSKGPGRPSC